MRLIGATHARDARSAVAAHMSWSLRQPAHRAPRCKSIARLRQDGQAPAGEANGGGEGSSTAGHPYPHSARPALRVAPAASPVLPHHARGTRHLERRAVTRPDSASLIRPDPTRSDPEGEAHRLQRPGRARRQLANRPRHSTLLASGGLWEADALLQDRCALSPAPHRALGDVRPRGAGVAVWQPWPALAQRA